MLTSNSTDSIALDEGGIHNHVRAYIRNRRLNDACTLLHTYEEAAIASAAAEAESPSATSALPFVMPSQKTYSLAIGSLLAQNHSHSRSLAWDMFAHMRFAAHPIPDARLYSIMLNACANAPESQAERGLDLWTEMRVDNKISPSREAYNGIILACARASKDSASFAEQSFRFAREMLDAYRNGATQLAPDVNTFNALLESVKRTGDLRRARWILAELVRSSTKGPNSTGGIAPNEDIMAQIFQVYASYKPPFRRDLVRKIAHKKSPSPQEQPSSNLGAATEEIQDSAPDGVDGGPRSVASTAPSSPSILDVPQSRAEVLNEASGLFQRLITADDPSALAFRSVVPTTHLFNSYLSVVFAHASLAAGKTAYLEIFGMQKPNINRNARTYLLALQRCARSASVRTSRAVSDEALEFARVIWGDWVSSNMESSGTSPRTVEKIHSAMIRVLTL